MSSRPSSIVRRRWRSACNGCQMMSNLRELIPAATCGRALCATSLTALKRALASVEVTQSPSLLLEGMVGSRMPIAVSHGEGQVEVRDSAHLAQLESKVWWRCASWITSAK